MDYEPNHIGPQSMVPVLTLAGCRVSGGIGGIRGIGRAVRGVGGVWFPLGSDLPDQGQVSDRNELLQAIIYIGHYI